MTCIRGLAQPLSVQWYLEMLSSGEIRVGLLSTAMAWVLRHFGFCILYTNLDCYEMIEAEFDNLIGMIRSGCRANQADMLRFKRFR